MSDLFDFNSVKENDFELVPDGDYCSVIEKAEWKTSKAGDEYLNLCFKVAEGNPKGRVVFNMYNLFNKNEKARTIALQDMKKLLTCLGVDFSKSGNMSKEKLIETLLGGTVVVKIGNRTDDYGTKNTVKGYKKASMQQSAIPF